MDKRNGSAIHPKGDFFDLKGWKTNVKTEVFAGVTTFFAMAYIIMVNPAMLSQTGMPWGAVFLATILSAVVGTLMMGLFANVPYAQAPGMGLNAFFTFTVCFGLGFTWQEALAMVFLCGVLSVIITVTKIRKALIRAIPQSLQNAITGGIGLFIAFIGIKNAGLLQFTSDPGKYVTLDGGTVVSDSSIVPAMVKLNTAPVLLAVAGLILTVILMVRGVKAAYLIAIAAVTVLGIPFGVTTIGASISFTDAWSQLPQTFCAAFGNPGMLSLLGDPVRLPLVFMTVFAFSLSDIFDTVGAFIGTGHKSGLLNENEATLEEGRGLGTRLDRALFSDFVATSAGAVLGTSNVTTYIESVAGIGVGGRTGLTSVVTALLFLVSAFFAPLISAVPGVATAPALIAVGILMMDSFQQIAWSDIEEAVPSFFTAVCMTFFYSISYGIAAGFFFYCVIKTARGKAREVHPVLWASTGLFLLNFIIVALI